MGANQEPIRNILDEVDYERVLTENQEDGHVRNSLTKKKLLLENIMLKRLNRGKKKAQL